MGLAQDADGSLWMAGLHQLWRFDNFLDADMEHEGHDALFVPTTSHLTGEVDVHDVAIDAHGASVFVATRFNCLATLARRGSFRPIWRPPLLTDWHRRIAAISMAWRSRMARLPG